ncbi:transcription factor A, mitochondrial [Harmonia axyridis]|uniref:transcription factor A, mitochondrial n=1 Tax=Harmonia axyridis TaxID=115357 RepID=UPI001E276FB2|nr:transcription factor A, mitochondrial [Harmonia axyridis]
MFSNNLISKAFNVGRLFIPHNFFYIPLAGVKTKDVIIDLPEKPKKPVGPFFRFIKDHKPILLKDNPELKITDVIKKCAEDWKNSSVAIREKYDNEYKKEIEDFNKIFLDYSMRLTEEQREYLKQLSREKTASKKKRKLKQKLKELHKPKKPANAFFLYIMDQARTKGHTAAEEMKSIKGSWYLLDESEKKTYYDKATQLMDKYKEDLLKWEKSMIQEGHIDVVRRKSLEERRPLTAKKAKAQKKKTSRENKDKNE